MAAWGFHDGELAVQRLAGVQLEAKRLEVMLGPPDLDGGAAKFLAEQTFVALTARDHRRTLWTSALAAAPGFLSGDADVLLIAATPRQGDPLHGMPSGQQIGLVAIDFAKRRRLRINGTLIEADSYRLVVRADQAYGNCPQYIHRRHPDPSVLSAAPSAGIRRSNSLTDADQTMISAADTFFLGTTHPTRGSDASHRGGPPGFVQICSPTELWWPDYPGNNMFNSFGNLAVDDEAALLFTDFTTGATVQISGSASLQWADAQTPGAAPVRRVAFSVNAVVVGSVEKALPSSEMDRNAETTTMTVRKAVASQEEEVACSIGKN